MNSHLPVGRLADRLHSLPRERAWFAILLSVTALALANAHFPRIGLAPLYIPIVCAACWALGSRAGYLVAIVAEQPLQIGSHLVQRILTGFSQCLQEEEASFQVVILIAINECTINGVDACFPIPIVEERLGVIKALGALGLWEHGVAE